MKGNLQGVESPPQAQGLGGRAPLITLLKPLIHSFKTLTLNTALQQILAGPMNEKQPAGRRKLAAGAGV